MRRTKKELELLLQSKERELEAFREWFYCETRHVVSFIHDVFDDLGRHVMTVRVHGAKRSQGGVAIIEHMSQEGYFTYPEFFDDLRSKWHLADQAYIRQASVDMERKRAECLRQR